MISSPAIPRGPSVYDLRSPNPVIGISEGDFENVFLRLVGDPAQRYPLRDDFMVDDKRRGRGFPKTVNQIFRKPVAIGAPSGFVDISCWHPSTSSNNASIAAAIDRCRSNHCLGNDCKTGTAAYRRAKVDVMPKAGRRPSDDEQPEPEAIRARRIEPEERLEYARPAMCDRAHYARDCVGCRRAAQAGSGSRCSSAEIGNRPPCAAPVRRAVARGAAE